MSVWNAILQATHSALIDELNERYPDEKLELGLPKRVDGGIGSDAGAKLLFYSVTSNEGQGFVALAGKAKPTEKELAEVLGKTVTRTEKEYKIRNIDAKFGAILPKAPEKVTMTIWLPIVIRRPSGDAVYDMALGLGV
jgi:hypothetical protein